MKKARQLWKSPLTIPDIIQDRGCGLGRIGLFGTGETSIRTTQDLMIFSGIPPFVREGDYFKAGFTVRNASSRSMDLTVTGEA